MEMAAWQTQEAGMGVGGSKKEQGQWERVEGRRVESLMKQNRHECDKGGTYVLAVTLGT